MAKLVGKIPFKGDKALELAMRDTLDGLFDTAAYIGFHSSPETMHILSIEQPKSVNFSRPPAQIVPVQSVQDITDYLIQRELHLERLPI
ncbi:hypothetical protein MNBD_GAMMA21-560 [hydrothermal vent metagenome]|uniref:Uncharacterized protein n=1 Tax=hydrothermal vent metagenome TaxID=652676 RepID=A0A3B0ZXI1_9ZZZZ